MKRRVSLDILFIFPCLFAFLMVIIVPFGIGIYYSLTDWNGVNPIINFVGLKNFTGMFQEPQFLYSFLITLAYTAINVALVNLVSFSLSLMVTSGLKLRNLYRAGFFIPNLIGGIVLGYIWQFVFNNVQVDLLIQLIDQLSFLRAKEQSENKLREFCPQLNDQDSKLFLGIENQK